jgi:hypothetical protein
MRSERRRILAMVAALCLPSVTAGQQPPAQSTPVQHPSSAPPASPPQSLPPSPATAGPGPSGEPGSNKASERPPATESNTKVEHPLIDLFKPAKPAAVPPSPLALGQLCQGQRIWRGSYCETPANTPTGSAQTPEVLSFTRVERGPVEDRIVISWPVIGNTSLTLHVKASFPADARLSGVDFEWEVAYKSGAVVLPLRPDLLARTDKIQVLVEAAGTTGDDSRVLFGSKTLVPNASRPLQVIAGTALSGVPSYTFSESAPAGVRRPTCWLTGNEEPCRIGRFAPGYKRVRAVSAQASAGQDCHH